MIFPIAKLADYFSISAVYRVKASGSAPVPPTAHQSVTELLKAEDPDAEIWSEGKYLYMRASRLAAKMILIDDDGSRYYLSPTEDAGVFQIRKLSHTRNMNVIFSISLKPEARQNSEDLKEFLQALSVS